MEIFDINDSTKFDTGSATLADAWWHRHTRSRPRSNRARLMAGFPDRAIMQWTLTLNLIAVAEQAH